MLASLNHPNIAAIYGIEESNGVQALVLELVDGPTLAELLAWPEGHALPNRNGAAGDGLQTVPRPCRALSLDEALPIARQIAEALEAAHEMGIVHRDLKPANVKVRDDGTVKVLDFGLAKMLDSPSRPAEAGRYDPLDVTNSPTITSPAMMTGVGMILGTAAYMSPEQAKGRPADKRSDVWAFGCVLFEMLTGKRAFEGEDVSDTLAAVLRGEPDWAALPPDAPPAIRTLVKRCLEKDRRQRIGDVAGALFILREPTVGAPATAAVPAMPVPRAPFWRRATPLVIAAAVIGALGVVVGRTIPRATAPPVVSRSAFTLPEGQLFVENGNQVVAMSRDGAQMAYWANQKIYVRSLADFDARPIPGTEAQGVVGSLAFSPDGRSIAFWSGNAIGTSNGVLKRVAVTGAVPVTVARIRFPLGMSWGGDGIVFGQQEKGIMRVAENGGQPELLVGVKDGLVWDPQMLPGGEAVLFTLTPGIIDPSNTSLDTWDNARIVVQPLKSGQRKTIREGGLGARYLPTGHLVYAVGGVLFAVPFDLKRQAATGGPVPVVEGVGRPIFTNAAPGSIYYDVSDTGSLIYVPGPSTVSSPQMDLAFSDRKGSNESLGVRPGAYVYPRISPDGNRLAVGTDDGKSANVWIYDLSGAGAMRQLTLGGKNRFPVWSPDGQWVAFQSDRDGDLAIFRQRADGGTAAERLTKPDQGTAHIPESWSPDGRTLSFSEAKGETFVLWMLSLPDKKTARFGNVQSTLDPVTSVFSPDGHWIAYTSSDGDNRTIFVQELAATAIKHPIVKGAWHPLWSPDGTELFYRVGVSTREEVVKVTTKPSFSVGNPEMVSTGLIRSRGRYPREYDITPDGKRFIGVIAAGQTQSGARATPQINVVLNWFEELKSRLPVMK